MRRTLNLILVITQNEVPLWNVKKLAQEKEESFSQ
jgi:hypothetical protein